MSEIICPSCHKAFKVDNSGYSEIVKQVRDKEFKSQIEQQVKQEKEIAILNALNPVKDEKEILVKEIQKLKSKLKQEVENKDNARNLAISEALRLEEQEKNDLKNKVKILENDLNNSKESQKIRLRNFENEKELEIQKKVGQIKDEKKELEHKLKTNELEKNNFKITLEKNHSLEMQSLKDRNFNDIKAKDEQIEFYKDMKQKLSTKMLGETLEQHCETEFNKLRSTAFQTAQFSKDNDASSGTKGDFIYKENDQFGNEMISIMFEMKNENDSTINKKRNEDFFTKLDRDRTNKKCEYAILVSLLESDNEFYNTGIADVSYKFDKMYVVRPQFFIPIITLLRNSAMKSLKYKQEMEIMRNQNIDVTTFEDKITSFKDGFTKNYESASKNFKQSIDEIDKSIIMMEKVKKSLLTTENQLRLANDKTQDLTIKKLTYNNKTMKNKFDRLDSK